MIDFSDISLIATAYLPDQLLELNGAVFLFLGRSNVGKSSLINAIFPKNLAKVSKTPGKTRSVNYFKIPALGTVIDLPGYGYAQRGHDEKENWEVLMKEFFDSLPPDSLALILMDSQRDLEQEEFDLIDALNERLVSIHILLTKADRLNQSERQKRSVFMKNIMNEVDKPLTWSFVSTKDGEGIQDLTRLLLKYAKEIKNKNSRNA